MKSGSRIELDQPVVIQVTPILECALNQAQRAVVLEGQIVAQENGTKSNGSQAHMESMMGDAPPCDSCGHITVRNGTCYKCLNCGNSLGCS